MRRTKNRAAASGSRLHLFGGLVFTLVAVSAWLLINVQNLQEFLDTYKQREEERAQIDVLKQKIKRLKRQQQSLAFNGIESQKQVRERMNLHMPGEQVLYLKNEEEPKAEQAKAVQPNNPVVGKVELPQQQSAAPDATIKSPTAGPGSKPARREKPALVNKSENVQ
ncbi:MAG: hypothetical protein ACR2IE_17710 [Candidatus Sumerlaeaceae bacterium]